MKNLVIFLILLCALWMVGVLFEDKQENDYKFMSVQHTNICRAIAAIIIIIIQHVSGGFEIRYLTPLGGIGVAMFLILSGYGLNESYKKKKSGGYWKKKVVRVLIPYLIVSMVVIGLQILCSFKIEIPYYWYLDFILFWYLVFYLIISIPGMYAKRYWILSVTSIMVFIACTMAGSGLRAEQALSFLIGIWISDNYESAREVLTNKGILFTLVITGGVLLMTKQIPIIRIQGDTVLWQGIQLGMKVSFAMALIGFIYCFRRIFNSGFIALVSKISYELYLVHFRLLRLPQKGVMGMCSFLGLSIIGAWVVNKISSYIKKRIC